MIRVLVVDDSLTVRQRLIEIISRDPQLEVVGEAADGRRAFELVRALRPDIVTLDIVMPELTGLAATEQIMAHHPTPILIVSSSFNRGELFDTYAALAAGAVDVLENPDADDADWEVRFLAALRMVSKIKVITHPRGRLGAIGRARGAPTLQPPSPTHDVRGPEVIAIGASTGGPGALLAVLGAMSAPFPVPILLVLHIDGSFGAAFAVWLRSHTKHAGRLAVDGARLEPGHVLLGPSGTHLAIEQRCVRLIKTPPRNHCRPSIDVLFDSLAVDYGARVAACILTGMGRDGAAGLLAIRRAGGATFGQDEASSVIYGMPREAAICGAVERELPLGEIGRALDALRHT